jgi:ribose transport system permease protein
MAGGRALSSLSASLTRSPGGIRRLLQDRIVVLIAILVLYNVAFAVLKTGTFFNADNYMSILLNMSIESFIVIGMTMLLISGNLDLSLGANMAFAGIICGYLVKFSPLGIIGSFLVTLLVSVCLGAFNGYLVAFVGVNPLITTLATGFVYQGIAVWIAGPGYTDFPHAFQFYGQAKLLSMQLPIWYMLVIVLIFQLLMAGAPMFRNFYFVGGNKRAASMSGINTAFTTFIVFVLAAALASCAGFITSSRFNASLTGIGTGVELRAVTAAVIGGVSFAGGTGSILGAFLGALFLSFINNGLIILGVAPSWQNVVVGVILILSIVIDVPTGKRM